MVMILRRLLWTIGRGEGNTKVWIPVRTPFGRVWICTLRASQYMDIITEIRRLVKQGFDESEIQVQEVCLNNVKGCEYAGSMFECDTCERWVCWCKGADDQYPHTCDDCWREIQRLLEEGA